MNDQFRRKLAACLAAVMFVTSIPVSAVAEVVPEPETVTVAQPVAEPEKEPEQVQPAAEPEKEPEQVQPAAEPEKEPEQVQPAAEPEKEPEQDQPAAEPEKEPEQDQPAAEPEKEPVQEQPAAKPEKEPVQEQPAAKPETVPQQKLTASAAPALTALDGAGQESLVLADPVVSLPDSVQAGEDIVLTWEPVENAQRYSIEVYRDVDGRYGDYLGGVYPGSATSAAINLVLEAGTYRVDVFSQAEDYESGCTTVTFTVTGELVAPPVLSLASGSYVTNKKIPFTVTAEGADRIRLHIDGTTDEGYGYSVRYEFAATGTTTVYEEDVSSEGTFQARCSARVDGIWSAWSEPVSFDAHYLGELSAPVLTMQDSYAAGEEIEVSWSAVEHAEEYFVSLYDSEDNYVDSWWTEAGETSIVMDTVLEAGSYTVQVYARAEGWKAHEEVKHSFTVTGALAEGPSFTVDKTTVVTGSSVTFTVSMEGATAFRLLYNHNAIEYAAENGAATITRTLYGAGDVVAFCFSACVDGVWTAYGPAQEITIEDMPTLGSTLPVLPESVRAGEDIEVTWEPVEHAENYSVYVGKLVDGNRYEQEWSDYLDAATEECRTVIPAGKLKQGSYLVSVSARASGYHEGKHYGVEMEVGAPLPENAFDCYISSDGTEAYLRGYLGDPNVAEVVIPETIKGATVMGIYYGGFLKNNGTLKKVTIPASVTSIPDDAFAGSVNLTICGYYGSEAEEYAILNGYAFEALDSAQPAIGASWTELVLVNKEMTFDVSAPGATEVVMYEGGYRNYYNTVVLTNGGASVRWTPDEIGTHCVRFEARVDGQWLTTKNYALEVTSGGQMPKARNLKASASTIEPGTAVTITWDAPEGVTAPVYGVNVVDSNEDLDDYSYWYPVDPGKSAYTFSAANFEKEGTYTLAVRVEADPGYEPSIVTCTVKVKSTKLWDFNADRNKVIGYHGTDKEIVIPSQIDGVPVYTIGDSLFAGSDITSVVIPEGVRTIGYYAFQNCTALTTVSLPTTLRSIYMMAFDGCTSLTGIRLPDEMYYIYSHAFARCKALTSVTIPAGITELENSLFSQCSALSSVTLPDGLVSIDSYAFGYCDSLRTITIPQSVVTIDKNAFRDNDDLTICGYSGSAAETFAGEQGYDFVALDSVQTGDISFTLERDTLYYGGLMKITVTAPGAQKLRLHLDGEISECSISGGKAEISRHIHSLGEHSVTVSQCVDGKWMAPCEAMTFTVIEMAVPVIENIDPVPAQTPVTVRWKPVEGAVSYSVYLTKDDAYLADFQNVQSLDKDGYVYQQLEGSLLSHEGIYSVQVTARAADSGSTHSTRAFEVTAAEEFLYEVNPDGTATLTGHTGVVQDVIIPAQLDGHTLVAIAEKAFLNSQAVSITLPATVEMVNTRAFYGCEALQTVRISDAVATLRPFFFEECPKLVSVYAGAGIFAEEGAFDNCRKDTVVYGWSGGQLEEEVLTACRFSSLGELAAGPVAEAEDIWQNETLNYSVTCQGASSLHIQVIYPDGHVKTVTGGTGSFAGKADDYNFNNITENCVVRFRTAALVNGAWTAYGEKEVTVSVLGVLTEPVFEQIGRLERHREHVLRWYPVEHAESYDVTIFMLQHTQDYAETMDASCREIKVRPGSLYDGTYTIRVTAKAEGYRDATATAQFEVYEMKLDTPVLSVDKRIARHTGAEIRWDAVSEAEYYAVTVRREDETGTVTLYNGEKVEDTKAVLTPDRLEPGMYTVSVTANAKYCTASDAATATFEVYEEQLDAPEVTAPEAVVGGVAFDVTWKSVEGAQRYHLEVMDENGYRLVNRTVGSQTLSCTVSLDAYRPEGPLTLRVIASADYRVNGVAEQPLSYKPLYSYEVVDGSAVITGYNGPDTVLTVPDIINGYDVTAIGDGAFENMTALKKVYLPESITSIGARGFKNCTSLEEIEGDGVTWIGEEAFYNCTSLHKFSFGKKHEYQVLVMNNAFQNTPALEDAEELEGLMDITVSQNQGGSGGEGGSGEVPSHAGSLYIGSVTYEEGVTRIPARTHYSNLLLGAVYLPQSLRSIGSEAFADCPSLSYMRVYDGIDSIAEDAFSGSDRLVLHIYTSDVEKTSYVEEYALLHNIPYEKHNALIRDERLYGLKYADGSLHVEERACFREPWLEKVWLPESLESIGSRAFAQCDSLSKVYLYDGITSIADDAFDGSNNVQFVVYTDDLEKESYVVQYAVEHGIPCVRELRLPEPGDRVDTTDPAPVTVRIDEPVEIIVSGIPSAADRVVLYSDGTEIGTMTAGGVTTESFSYTFRTFGRQVLTAEAYIGSEVVKLSWEKPVTVTGIRLRADRESAWTGETVNFTVEAYPETAEVGFYAEDLQFGRISLTENAGTFAYAFTESGERKITVRSDAGLQSKVLTLTISSLGQLEQPVLEAEPLQYTGYGLACSWNTTENTDGYVLRVRYANGADVLQRELADDGSERMTCTISAEDLGGAGVYELYLMNYGYRYDQNESETITVELTEDTTPVFTMDKQAVMTGETVNFTFRAFGATAVELWADGEAIETIALTNGRGVLSRAFTQSGERKIAIRALQEDGWTEPGEIQVLTVTSLGVLDAVQVTAQSQQLLGNAIKASWTAVDNAAGYTVYFRNEAHETVCKLETAECAVSVPADLVQQSGSYYFLVMAHGIGYDQSEGSAAVTVLDRLPGPVIVTPAENEACTNTDVTVTWQAVAGAQSYVVSLARKTEERDAYGQPVYEKVWEAPNETVNVGTALSHALSGLVYGGEYRVAVGAAVMMDSGEQVISWTDRLFSVQLPQLAVTLTADNLTPNEGTQITLTAVANHPMTRAVLTDETGAEVKTVSSGSTEANGTRVFTFVVTAEEQGQKTYTVTVSGTGALEEVQPVPASLSVKWIDPEAAAIRSVLMEPASAIVGKPVTFTITSNAKTTAVEVYVRRAASVLMRNAGTEAPVETLTPSPASDDKTISFYTTQFEEAGEVNMIFVPYNAKSEKGEEFSQTVIVNPKGKLPNPNITAPALNAKLSTWGCTVTWDPVVLAPGESLGGYCVTVKQVGASGHWEAIPGHTNIFVGTTCYYNIPAMAEGAYRVEVFTVPAGMNQPSAEFSGNSFVEFWMNTPAVTLTNPAVNAVCMSGSPIAVDGTTAGGVTKVLVQIKTAGNNAKVVPVKDASGNAVDHLVVDVVNGTFSAVLDPVKRLAPASYGVEAYGFLDGMPIDPAGTTIKDYHMIKVELGKILADGNNPRHWEFEGNQTVFQVRTGTDVSDIVLYDRTEGKNLPVKFKRDDKTAGVHIFTATAGVPMFGEGLHEIVAADLSGRELATLDLYVVTPTGEDIPKNCPDGQTIRVWLYPVEVGGYLRDVTSADTLVQKGTCGQYLLLWVNDSAYGFVHKDKLGSEIRLIYPTESDTIVLSQKEKFEIRWTPATGAKSYNLILTTHYIDRQGKESSMLVFSRTIPATTAPEQKFTVHTSVISNNVKPLSSVINTDWVTTIEITANS